MMGARARVMGEEWGMLVPVQTAWVHLWFGPGERAWGCGIPLQFSAGKESCVVGAQRGTRRKEKTSSACAWACLL